MSGMIFEVVRATAAVPAGEPAGTTPVPWQMTAEASQNLTDAPASSFLGAPGLQCIRETGWAGQGSGQSAAQLHCR